MNDRIVEQHHDKTTLCVAVTQGRVLLRISRSFENIDNVTFGRYAYLCVPPIVKGVMNTLENSFNR